MIKRWMSYVVLMILMMISVHNVCAESIDLDYPENVIVGEEFNIDLTFNDFDEDIYSVKIDILDGSNHLAQRFWDNSWYQNRWMYNATDTSETNNPVFRLKVNEDFEGIADLIVKIKSENYNEAVFIGYIVNISMLDNPNPEPNPEPEPPDPTIYLELDWEKEDIINGAEFEIKLKVFNLKDQKYNVKVWIEFKNNNTKISERYGEDNYGDDGWKAGRYWAYDFLSGPGDKTKYIKIRIDEDYKQYYGDARIYFQLKDETTINQVIKILEEEPEEDEGAILEDNEDDLMERVLEVKQITEQDSSITGDVIQLGGNPIKDNNAESESIKSKNSIIYQSSTEKIKKYSIFGFAFLCMMLSILLIKEKL